ncbi:MAG: Holliday junction branch migration protein RuvA [Bacteroidales bacterium]|jgi:Holliday junction DNA helicase RuvA|nr:Holliday junction branch migration protein RuvA [Bacteroidales bacterium]
MITYLKGKITEKNPAFIVVETAGGVGYMVHISLATFSKIKDLDEVTIFTHFMVKEDGQALYGFFDAMERSVFRLLISISGVGANTARLILSSLSVQELSGAIATDNVAIIQAIKGIGAKTAQRIIIELKDKISKADVQKSEIFSVSYNNNKNEALSALVLLGFSKASSDSVLDKIIKAEGIELTVEELIKKALKLL